MVKKVIVTGATGFIGSNLLAALERKGYKHIVAFDNFGNEDKWKNVAKRSSIDFLSPLELWEYLDSNSDCIQAIVHLGAISSTTESDVDAVMSTNYKLSVDLYEFCIKKGIQFIYASSASTYGDGSNGFVDSDDFNELKNLRPLNPYGWSKQQTDLFISRHNGFNQPSQVVGLKFFNAYGPNEYHKGSQSSVVYTFYNQLSSYGFVKLFASNDPIIADGDQKRDFVYVDDCIDIILWFLSHPDKSGIFNVGTGCPCTFNNIVEIMSDYMGLKPRIKYIPIPENISRHYQNHTCASLDKLRAAGYTKALKTPEEGIKDYIENFLNKDDKYK